MATVGMLKPVHIIKNEELEHLANAYELSKKWCEENNGFRKPSYSMLEGNEIQKAMSDYRWDD
ncbi:MAG: hypothetical protein IKN43_02995 [Selenomonadaceae bacterium]|nr:hypothetical protein [Selenomonadaceae bacterium]